MKVNTTGYVHGYDFNCALDYIRIEAEEVIPSVDKSLFTVTETKQVTDFTDVPAFPVVVRQFERKVEDAYYVDENNRKVNEPGKAVMLKLKVDPDTGVPLLFSFHSFLNTWSDPYEVKITCRNQFETELTMENVITSADDWKLSSFKATDGTSYNFAHYEPEEGSKNLVIWLHGIGEGGTDHTDARVPLLANKADVLKRDEFQETVGKANILVPQCPTFWMDNTGEGKNLNHGRIEADGTSFYLESLMELIQDYRKKTGSEKIVVAGCSNGGYMTVLLAMKYPDEFDGYVPVCEAMPDKYITDKDVSTLMKEKLYFVYSKDDETVIPSLHEEPLLARMKGAKNVHVSTTEHVTDMTGNYFAPGTSQPYQYNGHWSWIRFFNNECDADGLKAWDFIRDCLK